MDNLSHAIIGTAVAAMAPPGTPAPILWATILAAELPDFDYVIRFFGGPVTYLKFHRGPSHGLVTLPVQAALVAGLVTLLSPAGFGAVFWWALLGGLSHVIFDLFNDYGTQGGWPFSTKWIAMDFVPIVDFGLIGLIAGGWLAHWLWPGHLRAIFAAVWLLIAAYMVLRYLLRKRAHDLVVAHFDLSDACGEAASCGAGWTQERVTVHPLLLSLNAWRYVVQMQDEYLLGTVWVRQGTVGEPERAENRYDKVVMASMKSALVSAFAGWVRRPRVTVERQGELFLVLWREARYEVDNYTPFSAYAWLDQHLTLVDEGLGKQQPEQMDRAAIRRRLRREMGRENA
ncbi:MAG TPA: metal-dependent hydrolase [Symbiobacteriaceae bacterium]|jgi:inner membrane protein|nr:metal-dependent hydrolase [Symbiobacteriaceae bacterium]